MGIFFFFLLLLLSSFRPRGPLWSNVLLDGNIDTIKIIFILKFNIENYLDVQ
jgi:hypothetical protein